MTTSTDRQTFRQLVAEIAAKAKATLPTQVNGRIESAVKLVLSHDVTVLDDGSIEVGSASDPLKVYRLTGQSCDCQDFAYGQAPDGWCQHRIAAGIARRVQQLLPVIPEPLEPWPDNDPEDVPQSPAAETEPTPATQPLPEAAFSLCLKGRLAGQDAQLTIRGATYVCRVRGQCRPRARPARPGAGACQPPGRHHAAVPAAWRAAPGQARLVLPPQAGDDTWCKSKGK